MNISQKMKYHGDTADICTDGKAIMCHNVGATVTQIEDKARKSSSTLFIEML